MLNSAQRLQHYSSGLKDEASDCHTGQAGEEQQFESQQRLCLGYSQRSCLTPFRPLWKKKKKEGAWKQRRNSTERARCSAQRNLQHRKQQPQCDRFVWCVNWRWRVEGKESFAVCDKTHPSLWILLSHPWQGWTFIPGADFWRTNLFAFWMHQMVCLYKTGLQGRYL